MNNWALVETLAIGCHATNRGASQQGDHVLIIGAGPIGLATLEFTRLTGATVTVMDMVPSRLEFCQQNYGIEHTIPFKGDGSELAQMQAITNGDMYPVVTDATGNKHSMASAMKYVAYRIAGLCGNHDRRNHIRTYDIASSGNNPQGITECDPRGFSSHHSPD